MLACWQELTRRATREHPKKKETFVGRGKGERRMHPLGKHLDWEGRRTVGYFFLLESKSELQLYAICAMLRPAVR